MIPLSFFFYTLGGFDGWATDFRFLMHILKISDFRREPGKIEIRLLVFKTMEPLATRYPICDSVTMASHCLYGIPFPFASTSIHPNNGCMLCSGCLINGGLVFDYVMEIWDPPDTINLGKMCSAPVALYGVYFSWNGRIWKEVRICNPAIPLCPWHLLIHKDNLYLSWYECCRSV